MKRTLTVAGRTINFPTFLPVTTFGGRFPIDNLARPYLARSFPAMMVSYHYAKQMREKPTELLFIDSGGFASLFDGSHPVDRGDYFDIATREGDRISPPEVLAFQESFADIGATVDFIIAPSCAIEEAKIRQAATIKNAIWAIERRSKFNFKLYASLQAWDEASAKLITEKLATYPFDGYALGGMVPRIKKPEEIITIVRAIRSVDIARPLHVFGIGNADLIRELFQEGVDSTDSSSWVRSAVDGKYLNPNTGNLSAISDSNHQNCTCPVCLKFDYDYLSLEGEANRMALALHNLHALRCLIKTTPSLEVASK